MEAWGAPYLTCAFTWYKTMRTQPGFKMNGGSYTRSNTEPCLLGRPSGKALERKSKKVRQVIHEEVAEPQAIEEPLSVHSKKPEEFYRRVKELYAGYQILELFSRTPRRGFRVLGNEIDGDDIRVALEKIAKKRL
jgi:N6-adenosine-specific RNA methylase IME4